MEQFGHTFTLTRSHFSGMVPGMELLIGTILLPIVAGLVGQGIYSRLTHYTQDEIDIRRVNKMLNRMTQRKHP